MDKKISLEFTEGEIIALRQLIHHAVQARGMEVASAAVILDQKITNAVKMQMSKDPDVSPDKPHLQQVK